MFLCSRRKKKKTNRVYPVPTGAGHDGSAKRHKKKNKWTSCLRELEQLRERERALQEARLEQEEEMWRRHEEHRAEVEDERQLLKSRMSEHDASRAEAELELEETRRKLAEEQALSYETTIDSGYNTTVRVDSPQTGGPDQRKLDAELQKLRKLEEAQSTLKEKACKELGVQTTTELMEFTTQTDDIAGKGATVGEMSAVEAQIQSFAEMYSAQIQQLKANVEMQKEQLSQMEALQEKMKDQSDEDIKEQQVAIQKIFLVQSERLQLEQNEIEEKEKRYREQDKSQLESVVKQTEMIEQLSHRQKQLFMYIQEKEQRCQLGAERMEPLGESCSDESLNSSRGYTRQTKASRNKHQLLPASDKKASTFDQYQSEIQAQVHASQSSPLSTPTSERPLSASPLSGGNRDRSPRLQGKTSITRSLTTPESSSNKQERRSSPKLRTSPKAERVTARLYQQSEASRQGDSSPRRRQDHSPQQTPQSRTQDREPVHTRSKSAPGPLRVPPLFPHHHDPQQNAASSSSSIPSAKLLTSSDPRLPQQMLSSHPRLRQSSSSLASVAESIDESLDDYNLETPGKDSAFDEVSMDTLDSLQDDFPSITVTANNQARLPKDGSGLPSPGRPPGEKDPPGTSKAHSQDLSDDILVKKKAAVVSLASELKVPSDSNSSLKELSGPLLKKPRLNSEGPESGVEIRDSGDEVSSSSMPKEHHPEEDIPQTTGELTTSGSIPHGQQLSHPENQATEAGSSVIRKPNKVTDHQTKTSTFHKAGQSSSIPASQIEGVADLSGSTPSIRSKSSSPARKSRISKDEDNEKRKSRSTSLKGSTSKNQQSTEETKSPPKRNSSGKSPSTQRKGSGQGSQTSGSSPVVGRRASEKNSRSSPSPSLRRKAGDGKAISSRSGSRESTTSGRDRSASLGSSVGNDRRMSIDSISSLDSNTSSSNKIDAKPPTGSTGRKGSGRKASKDSGDDPQEGSKSSKSAKKREYSKDLGKAEAMLSKPKKRSKEEIPVEIYLPAGSVGGGGGVSLDIGSDESASFHMRSNDPTHDLFARSLRSGPEKDQADMQGRHMEEVTYTEDGTKIIKRGFQRRGSVESLSSTDGRGSDKGLPTRRHPDGQTQTSEEGETEGDGYNWREPEGIDDLQGSKVVHYEVRKAAEDVKHGLIKRAEYSYDSLDEDDDKVQQYQQALQKQLDAEEQIFSEDSLDWDADSKRETPSGLCQSDVTGYSPAVTCDADKQTTVLSQSAPVLNTEAVLPEIITQQSEGALLPVLASRVQPGPEIVIDVASDQQPDSLRSEDINMKADERINKELNVPMQDQPGQISVDSLSEVVEEGVNKQSTKATEDQGNKLRKPPQDITPGASPQSARRAIRERAARRQEHESDQTGAFSDDSLASDKPSQSSSRPTSASKRRRRQPRIPEGHYKRPRTASSEEYVTSDNDSVYSEDSLLYSDEKVLLDDGVGDYKEERPGMAAAISGITDSVEGLTSAIEKEAEKNIESEKLRSTETHDAEPSRQNKVATEGGASGKPRSEKESNTQRKSEGSQNGKKRSEEEDMSGKLSLEKDSDMSIAINEGAVASEGRHKIEPTAPSLEDIKAPSIPKPKLEGSKQDRDYPTESVSDQAKDSTDQINIRSVCTMPVRVEPGQLEQQPSVDSTHSTVSADSTDTVVEVTSAKSSPRDIMEKVESHEIPRGTDLEKEELSGKAFGDAILSVASTSSTEEVNRVSMDRPLEICVSQKQDAELQETSSSCDHSPHDSGLSDSGVSLDKDSPTHVPRQLDPSLATALLRKLHHPHEEVLTCKTSAQQQALDNLSEKHMAPPSAVNVYHLESSSSPRDLYSDIVLPSKTPTGSENQPSVQSPFDKICDKSTPQVPYIENKSVQNVDATKQNLQDSYSPVSILITSVEDPRVTQLDSSSSMGSRSPLSLDEQVSVSDIDVSIDNVFSPTETSPEKRRSRRNRDSGYYSLPRSSLASYGRSTDGYSLTESTSESDDLLDDQPMYTLSGGIARTTSHSWMSPDIVSPFEEVIEDYQGEKNSETATSEDTKAENTSRVIPERITYIPVGTTEDLPDDVPDEHHMKEKGDKEATPLSETTEARTSDDTLTQSQIESLYIDGEDIMKTEPLMTSELKSEKQHQVESTEDAHIEDQHQHRDIPGLETAEDEKPREAVRAGILSKPASSERKSTTRGQSDEHISQEDSQDQVVGAEDPVHNHLSVSEEEPSQQQLGKGIPREIPRGSSHMEAVSPSTDKDQDSNVNLDLVKDQKAESLEAVPPSTDKHIDSSVNLDLVKDYKAESAQPVSLSTDRDLDNGRERSTGEIQSSKIQSGRKEDAESPSAETEGENKSEDPTQTAKYPIGQSLSKFETSVSVEKMEKDKDDLSIHYQGTSTNDDGEEYVPYPYSHEIDPDALPKSYDNASERKSSGIGGAVKMEDGIVHVPITQSNIPGEPPFPSQRPGSPEVSSGALFKNYESQPNTTMEATPITDTVEDYHLTPTEKGTSIYKNVTISEIKTESTATDNTLPVKSSSEISSEPEHRLIEGDRQYLTDTTYTATRFAPDFTENDSSMTEPERKSQEQDEMTDRKGINNERNKSMTEGGHSGVGQTSSSETYIRNEKSTLPTITSSVSETDNEERNSALPSICTREITYQTEESMKGEKETFQSPEVVLPSHDLTGGLGDLPEVVYVTGADSSIISEQSRDSLTMEETHLGVADSIHLQEGEESWKGVAHSGGPTNEAQQQLWTMEDPLSVEFGSGSETTSQDLSHADTTTKVRHSDYSEISPIQSGATNSTTPTPTTASAITTPDISGQQIIAEGLQQDQVSQSGSNIESANFGRNEEVVYGMVPADMALPVTTTTIAGLEEGDSVCRGVEPPGGSNIATSGSTERSPPITHTPSQIRPAEKQDSGLREDYNIKVRNNTQPEDYTVCLEAEKHTKESGSQIANQQHPDGGWTSQTGISSGTADLINPAASSTGVKEVHPEVDLPLGSTPAIIDERRPGSKAEDQKENTLNEQPTNASGFVLRIQGNKCPIHSPPKDLSPIGTEECRVLTEEAPISVLLRGQLVEESNEQSELKVGSPATSGGSEVRIKEDYNIPQVGEVSEDSRQEVNNASSWVAEPSFRFEERKGQEEIETGNTVNTEEDRITVGVPVDNSEEGAYSGKSTCGQPDIKSIQADSPEISAVEVTSKDGNGPSVNSPEENLQSQHEKQTDRQTESADKEELLGEHITGVPTTTTTQGSAKSGTLIHDLTSIISDTTHPQAGEHLLADRQVEDEGTSDKSIQERIISVDAIVTTCDQIRPTTTTGEDTHTEGLQYQGKQNDNSVQDSSQDSQDKDHTPKEYSEEEGERPIDLSTTEDGNQTGYVDSVSTANVGITDITIRPQISPVHATVTDRSTFESPVSKEAEVSETVCKLSPDTKETEEDIPSAKSVVSAPFSSEDQTVIQDTTVKYQSQSEQSIISPPVTEYIAEHTNGTDAICPILTSQLEHGHLNVGHIDQSSISQVSEQVIHQFDSSDTDSGPVLQSPQATYGVPDQESVTVTDGFGNIIDSDRIHSEDISDVVEISDGKAQEYNTVFEALENVASDSALVKTNQPNLEDQTHSYPTSSTDGIIPGHQQTPEESRGAVKSSEVLTTKDEGNDHHHGLSSDKAGVSLTGVKIQNEVTSVEECSPLVQGEYGQKEEEQEQEGRAEGQCANIGKRAEGAVTSAEETADKVQGESKYSEQNTQVSEEIKIGGSTIRISTTPEMQKATGSESSSTEDEDASDTEWSVIDIIKEGEELSAKELKPTGVVNIHADQEAEKQKAHIVAEQEIGSSPEAAEEEPMYYEATVGDYLVIFDEDVTVPEGIEVSRIKLDNASIVNETDKGYAVKEQNVSEEEVKFISQTPRNVSETAEAASSVRHEEKTPTISSPEKSSHTGQETSDKDKERTDGSFDADEEATPIIASESRKDVITSELTTAEEQSRNIGTEKVNIDMEKQPGESQQLGTEKLMAGQEIPENISITSEIPKDGEEPDTERISDIEEKDQAAGDTRFADVLPQETVHLKGRPVYGQESSNQAEKMAQEGAQVENFPEVHIPEEIPDRLTIAQNLNRDQVQLMEVETSEDHPSRQPAVTEESIYDGIIGTESRSTIPDIIQQSLVQQEIHDRFEKNELTVVKPLVQSADVQEDSNRIEGDKKDASASAIPSSQVPEQRENLASDEFKEIHLPSTIEEVRIEKQITAKDTDDRNTTEAIPADIKTAQEQTAEEITVQTYPSDAEEPRRKEAAIDQDSNVEQPHDNETSEAEGPSSIRYEIADEAIPEGPTPSQNQVAEIPPKDGEVHPKHQKEQHDVQLPADETKLSIEEARKQEDWMDPSMAQQTLPEEAQRLQEEGLVTRDPRADESFTTTPQAKQVNKDPRADVTSTSEPGDDFVTNASRTDMLPTTRPSVEMGAKETRTRTEEEQGSQDSQTDMPSIAEGKSTEMPVLEEVHPEISTLSDGTVKESRIIEEVPMEEIPGTLRYTSEEDQSNSVSPIVRTSVVEEKHSGNGELDRRASSFHNASQEEVPQSLLKTEEQTRHKVSTIGDATISQIGSSDSGPSCLTPTETGPNEQLPPITRLTSHAQFTEELSHAEGTASENTGNETEAVPSAPDSENQKDTCSLMESDHHLRDSLYGHAQEPADKTLHHPSEGTTASYKEGIENVEEIAEAEASVIEALDPEPMSMVTLTTNEVSYGTERAQAYNEGIAIGSPRCSNVEHPSFLTGQSPLASFENVLSSTPRDSSGLHPSGDRALPHQGAQRGERSRTTSQNEYTSLDTEASWDEGYVTMQLTAALGHNDTLESMDELQLETRNDQEDEHDGDQQDLNTHSVDRKEPGEELIDAQDGEDSQIPIGNIPESAGESQNNIDTTSGSLHFTDTNTVSGTLDHALAHGEHQIDDIKTENTEEPLPAVGVVNLQAESYQKLPEQSQSHQLLSEPSERTPSSSHIVTDKSHDAVSDMTVEGQQPEPTCPEESDAREMTEKSPATEGYLKQQHESAHELSKENQAYLPCPQRSVETPASTVAVIDQHHRDMHEQERHREIVPDECLMETEMYETPKIPQPDSQHSQMEKEKHIDKQPDGTKNTAELPGPAPSESPFQQLSVNVKEDVSSKSNISPSDADDELHLDDYFEQTTTPPISPRPSFTSELREDANSRNAMPSDDVLISPSLPIVEETGPKASATSDDACSGEDPGLFELVHYKAPDTSGKRKKVKTEGKNGNTQLVQSEFATLTTSDFVNMAATIPSDTGYIVFGSGNASDVEESGIYGVSGTANGEVSNVHLDRADELLSEREFIDSPEMAHSRKYNDHPGDSQDSISISTRNPDELNDDQNIGSEQYTDNQREKEQQIERRTLLSAQEKRALSPNVLVDDGGSDNNDWKCLDEEDSEEEAVLFNVSVSEEISDDDNTKIKGSSESDNEKITEAVQPEDQTLGSLVHRDSSVSLFVNVGDVEDDLTEEEVKLLLGLSNVEQEEDLLVISLPETSNAQNQEYSEVDGETSVVSTSVKNKDLTEGGMKHLQEAGLKIKTNVMERELSSSEIMKRKITEQGYIAESEEYLQNIVPGKTRQDQGVSDIKTSATLEKKEDQNQNKEVLDIQEVPDICPEKMAEDEVKPLRSRPTEMMPKQSAEDDIVKMIAKIEEARHEIQGSSKGAENSSSVSRISDTITVGDTQSKHKEGASSESTETELPSMDAHLNRFLKEHASHIKQAAGISVKTPYMSISENTSGKTSKDDTIESKEITEVQSQEQGVTYDKDSTSVRPNKNYSDQRVCDDDSSNVSMRTPQERINDAMVEYAFRNTKDESFRIKEVSPKEEKLITSMVVEGEESPTHQRESEEWKGDWSFDSQQNLDKAFAEEQDVEDGKQTEEDSDTLILSNTRWRRNSNRSASFVDTRIISFDVDPEQDSKKVKPITDEPQGLQQVVVGQQTVIDVEVASQSPALRSDFQVLGLQPTSKCEPRSDESDPDQVLTDELVHPWQKDLCHAGINIEIKPYTDRKKARKAARKRKEEQKEKENKDRKDKDGSGEGGASGGASGESASGGSTGGASGGQSDDSSSGEDRSSGDEDRGAAGGNESGSGPSDADTTPQTQLDQLTTLRESQSQDDEVDMDIPLCIEDLAPLPVENQFSDQPLLLEDLYRSKAHSPGEVTHKTTEPQYTSMGELPPCGNHDREVESICSGGPSDTYYARSAANMERSSSPISSSMKENQVQFPDTERSFSLSDLDVMSESKDDPEFSDNRSMSAECFTTSDAVEVDDMGTRAISNDSITFVFMTRPHSIDGLVNENTCERVSSYLRRASEPHHSVGSEEVENQELGKPDLTREKAASAEVLSSTVTATSLQKKALSMDAANSDIIPKSFAENNQKRFTSSQFTSSTVDSIFGIPSVGSDSVFEASSTENGIDQSHIVRSIPISHSSQAQPSISDISSNGLNVEPDLQRSHRVSPIQEQDETKPDFNRSDSELSHAARSARRQRTRARSRSLSPNSLTDISRRLAESLSGAIKAKMQVMEGSTQTGGSLEDLQEAQTATVENTEPAGSEVTGSRSVLSDLELEPTSSFNKLLQKALDTVRKAMGDINSDESTPSDHKKQEDKETAVVSGPGILNQSSTTPSHLRIEKIGHPGQKNTRSMTQDSCDGSETSVWTESSRSDSLQEAPVDVVECRSSNESEVPNRTSLLDVNMIQVNIPARPNSYVSDAGVQADNMQGIVASTRMQRVARDGEMPWEIYGRSEVVCAYGYSSTPQRTIETQTYPELRVIETQTHDQVRTIETQTTTIRSTESEKSDNVERMDEETEHNATQTESSAARPTAVVSMVDTGVNPSPPISPLTLSPEHTIGLNMTGSVSERRLPSPQAAWEDVIIPTIVRTENSITPLLENIMLMEERPMTPPPKLEQGLKEDVTLDEVTNQSTPIKSGQTDEVLDESDDEIYLRPVSLEDLLDAELVEDELSDIESDKEVEKVIQEQPLQTERIPKSAQDINIEVPQYVFTDPSLAGLKEEHEKMLALMNRSKEERKRRAEQRQELLERRRRAAEEALSQNLGETQAGDNRTSTTFATNDVRHTNVAATSRSDMEVSHIMSSSRGGNSLSDVPVAVEVTEHQVGYDVNIADEDVTDAKDLQKYINVSRTSELNNSRESGSVSPSTTVSKSTNLSHYGVEYDRSADSDLLHKTIEEINSIVDDASNSSVEEPNVKTPKAQSQNREQIESTNVTLQDFSSHMSSGKTSALSSMQEEKIKQVISETVNENLEKKEITSDHASTSATAELKTESVSPAQPNSANVEMQTATQSSVEKIESVKQTSTSSSTVTTKQSDTEGTVKFLADGRRLLVIGKSQPVSATLTQDAQLIPPAIEIKPVAEQRDAVTGSGADLLSSQHDSLSNLLGATININSTLELSILDSPRGSHVDVRDEAVGTDFKDEDYSDELERLRRERQRILDMLAKDMMPSKLQVELAEAQLNYIIGQTDTLLDAVDDNWEFDAEKLAELGYPENQLTEISNQYLLHYRQTLEASRKQIEEKIQMLEKETERSHRSRERTRRMSRMRKQAQIEAFKLEREREQHQYERFKNLPRSRSDSPAHRASDRESMISDSMESLRIPQHPIYGRFLTPTQRKKHLITKRKELLQTTKDSDRPRSLSPSVNSSTRSLPRAPSPALSTTSLDAFSTSNELYTAPGFTLYPSSESLNLMRTSVISSRQNDTYYSNQQRDYIQQQHLSEAGFTHTNYRTPRDQNESVLQSQSAAQHAENRQSGRERHDTINSDTASVVSVIDSLDDDTQRLLRDFQAARGRADQEIQRAQETLERRGQSSLNSSFSYTSPRSANNRPVYHTEIESFKQQYGLAGELKMRNREQIEQYMCCAA